MTGSISLHKKQPIKKKDDVAVHTNLLNLTARPRSAMQHVPFFLIRMFLLFRSLWAMAGFPCVP